MCNKKYHWYIVIFVHSVFVSRYKKRIASLPNEMYFYRFEVSEEMNSLNSENYILIRFYGTCDSFY